MDVRSGVFPDNNVAAEFTYDHSAENCPIYVENKFKEFYPMYVENKLKKKIKENSF